jgi:hypothetical protein
MTNVDQMDNSQVEAQYIVMKGYLTNHKKHGKKDKTFNRAVTNHIDVLLQHSNAEIKEGIEKAQNKTARIETYGPKAMSKMMDRSTTSNCNSKTIDNFRSLDKKSKTAYHRSNIYESSTYKRYDQDFGDAAVELLQGDYPNLFSIVLDCNVVLDMILSARKMMEQFGRTRDQVLAGDLPPKIFLILSLDGAKTFSNEGHNLCTMRLVDTGGFISSILAPDPISNKRKAGEDVSGTTSTTNKNKCHSVRIQYPIGLMFGKDDFESSQM